MKDKKKKERAHNQKIWDFCGSNEGHAVFKHTIRELAYKRNYLSLTCSLMLRVSIFIILVL